MATSKLNRNKHRATRPVAHKKRRGRRLAKAAPLHVALWSQIHKWPAVTWLVFAFVGFLVIVCTGFYLAYSQTVLSFKVAPSVVVDSRLAGPAPTRIVVNGTTINLPVIPAQIKDGIWETSEVAATHLITSANPTEPSNIVIYGHNKTRLFGPLLWVKPGQIIRLFDAHGKEYQYRITEIKTVNPDQIEVVLPTKTEVLTLYTCTGLFDSQRRVIKAEPILL